MTLALEGGPSLIYQHLEGEPANGYWAARLAERFESKLDRYHKSLAIT